MSRKIGIALLGCGRVAQHYAKIFGLIDSQRYQILGCCDLDFSKAASLSNALKSKSFTDYEAMLEAISPDLILILTPSGLHYQHSKIALEKGVHVLVEKPITMIPSQAIELEKISRDKGLLYCVAFQNRFNPAIQKIKSAFDSGRFGKIVTATIRLRWCRYQDYYNDGWHGTWEQDGGVINQQAIHHVDVINWLVGPVDSVSVAATKRLNQLEAEDTLVGLIKFKNGALGTIEATTAARPKDFEASLSVISENGIVQIGGIALNKIDLWNFTKDEIGDDEVPEKFSQEVPTGYGLSHIELLEKIFDELLSGQKPVSPIPVSDAISTTYLIHALYQSEEINGWVSVNQESISSRLGKKN